MTTEKSAPAEPAEPRTSRRSGSLCHCHDGARFAGSGETRMSDPLMILVAGPYRSGTNDDPALIEANVAAMTQAALDLFRLGHLPVMGEWFALPLIEAAGSTGIGDDVFNEIFHPIAERVLAKCDACLRIGGRSQGADRMVEVARRLGKTVFNDIAAIPMPATPQSKRSA